MVTKEGIQIPTDLHFNLRKVFSFFLRWKKERERERKREKTIWMFNQPFVKVSDYNLISLSKSEPVWGMLRLHLLDKKGFIFSCCCCCSSSWVCWCCCAKNWDKPLIIGGHKASSKALILAVGWHQAVIKLAQAWKACKNIELFSFQQALF